MNTKFICKNFCKSITQQLAIGIFALVLCAQAAQAEDFEASLKKMGKGVSAQIYNLSQGKKILQSRMAFTDCELSGRAGEIHFRR